MKLPKWLFWWPWLKKTVWDPFWWLIATVLILWVPFLRVWWWIFLPVMLVAQLKELYLWWLQWDYSYAKSQWVILELIPPKETLVPLKAMEDIFSVVWGLYDTGNFRDVWVDGELTNGPFWCSWEIVSLEGKIHFYVRVRNEHVLSIETAIYAHYPDVAIQPAQDYVKLVPPTVPNDEWDMYGEDWYFKKPDALPMKTYEKSFEVQGEKIAAEEKRMDPIISLLETMSRLGPNENYWVQFITTPITDFDEPEWKKEGTKLLNKLTKRPEKKELTFWDDLMYVFHQLVAGPEQEGSGESASYSWLPQQKEETGDREMVLTPGERDLITEIENKLKKPVFRTTIRGVYVAKRENWKSAHRILLRSYMAHFFSDIYNVLSFSGETRTKVNFFWRQRRVFLRARKMFRNTVLRFPPLFPNRLNEDINPILSVEEMATLYHLPVRLTGMVAPSMGAVNSKMSGPPPNLPIE